MPHLPDGRMAAVYPRRSLWETPTYFILSAMRAPSAPLDTSFVRVVRSTAESAGDQEEAEAPQQQGAAPAAHPPDPFRGDRRPRDRLFCTQPYPLLGLPRAQPILGQTSSSEEPPHVAVKWRSAYPNFTRMTGPTLGPQGGTFQPANSTGPWRSEAISLAAQEHSTPDLAVLTERSL
jgi:hypothetical protein